MPRATTSVGFDRTTSPEYNPLPLSPAADVPPQNHDVVIDDSSPGITGVPAESDTEKMGGTSDRTPSSAYTIAPITTATTTNGVMRRRFTDDPPSR